MAENPTFAEMLSRLRVAEGLTQEELAERAGMSVRGVSDLERGLRRRPQPTTLHGLCEALGLGAEERNAFEAAARGRSGEEPRTLKGFADPVQDFEIRPSPGSGEGGRPVAADPPSRMDAKGLPIGGFLGALPSGVLVARTEEMEILLASIEAVEAGSGRLLTLVGEPGVGKTRLVQEATLRLRDRGFLIAAGSCYEAQQTLAFYPFVDVIESLYERAPEEVRSDAPRRWAYLAKLLPGADFAAPAAAADGREEQGRLFWSVTGFVQAIAEHTPVALLLDDLHWADAASLGMLEHLVRHTRGDRVHILATYRDVEVGRQLPLEAAMRELSKQELVERIAVCRLDRAGTTVLAAAALNGQELSPEFAALLYERTEGNPFFVQQVMRVLVEKGDVYREGGHWTRKSIDEIEVPESIRSVVGQRLSRLVEETQEILVEASVLGQRFQFDDLLGMSGREEGALERALEEAGTSGLVGSIDGDHYAFDHALTQQALYEELSLRRRRRLHLAAGEVLERLPERKRQERVAELAWHFVQGDEPERALTYSLQAGDAAETVFAHGDAEMQYLTAIALARELGDKPREAQALERSGAVLYGAGREQEQIETLEKAQRVYASLGDLEGEGRAVAAIALALGELQRWEEAIDRVRRMLERFDGLPASPAQFALQEMLAGHLWHRGSYVEALAPAYGALALARDLGDQRFIGRAEGRRGLVLSALGRQEEAWDAYMTAIRLAEKVEDLDSLQRTLNNASLTALARGDIATYDRYRERRLEIVRRIGSPRYIVLALRNLGDDAQLRGDMARWRACVEEAVAVSRTSDDFRTAAFSTMVQGSFASFAGDDEGARRHFEEAVVEAERVGAHEIAQDSQRSLSTHEMINGQCEEAAARLLATIEHPDIHGHIRGFCLLELAFAYLGMSSQEGTRLAEATLVDERTELAGLHVAQATPSWLTIKAWLAARHGDRQEAGRLLEHAYAIHRRTGFVLDLAGTLLRHGVILRELGDPNAAREKLLEAIELYRQMGFVPYQR
jgi:transcriptional regulator with XRE-family HTH domain/tetratricopeptide (TPR) repeat protein